MSAADAAGFPLSSAQTGIWVAAQLDPSHTLFNLGEYLDIRGPVDPGPFRAALHQVMAECTAIQVRFEERDGAVRQVPVEMPDWEPAVLDLSDEADPRSAAEHWMRREMDRPFDLGAGPLFGHALLRIGPERHLWFHRYHHIVVDGMSGSLITHRVAALYTALVEGADAGPSPAAPLRQILDEDAGYRGSPEFATDRTFWAGKLAELPEPLDLAGRAATPSGEILRRELPLPRSAAEDLATAGRAARTRWSAVVLAAVAAYAHQAAGVQDVVLGLPVTGRRTPAARVTPGMFSNVVPLRVPVAEDTAVGELIHGVSRSVGEALRHQRYRLEDIRRDLDLGDGERELFGITVNIMAFDYQLAFAGHLTSAHNLTVGPVEGLTINVYDRADGEPLSVQFEADAARYDAAELDTHQRRFLDFLRRFAAADPQAPVADVDILRPADRDLLRALGDGGRSPQRPDQCLHEIFQEQVRRRPDAVAVVCDGRQLSYRELDARAEALARRVRAVAGPEQRVGVCVERSETMVAAVLAVLKAGCCYVPLDPGLPRRRLEFILQDAGLDVVVGRRRLVADLPHPVATLVSVDEIADGGGTADGDEDTRRADGPSPQRAVSARHAAYMIYTSGSTGRPKGVVVEHRSAVDFTRHNTAICAVDEDSRVLGFAALTFDVSVLELFGALLTGATLVLATDEERLDADRLQHLMARQNVTVTDLPAALLPLLRPAQLPALKLVSTGGEAPSGDAVDRWAADGREVWNTYGPTETTVAVTMQRCLPPHGGQSPPIGRPMPNHRAYVVGPGLRLLPPGAPGELCIAGAGLARGYLGRGALTAERFVPDPWGPRGSRMYRTGDLVRWSDAGELEFLGRIDHQVKINGHRIELGEIEAELARHPGVAQAAVTVTRTASGPRALVAYVVAADGHRPEPAALRDHLAASLPRPMVPQVYVPLARLPLTPSGKVDRAALPEPEQRLAPAGRAPRGGREALLCGLFAEALGMAEVGADDGFFELGGDSITAISLVSRARAAGLGLTLREVFEHRTAAALAEVVREAGPSDAADQGRDRAQDEAHGEVPLTPIVHWLRENGGPVGRFSQSMLVTTPRGAALERVTAAVQALLDQHGALRMTMTMTTTGGDGGRAGWDCRIRPRGSVAAAPLVTRVALGAPAEDSEESLRHALTEQAEAALDRLDPAAGALLQAVWCDRGPGHPGRLLLTVHHLAVDGVSWRILLADLAAAWEAVSEGRSPHLPPEPASLRGWARHLERRAQEPSTTAELPLWQRVLEPAGGPALGERRPDPARDTVASLRRLTLTVPAEHIRPLLTTVPGAFGTGVNEVFLAALAMAVGRWRQRRGLGEAPLLVDVEGHGRGDATGRFDLSRTVGWFTTQYPVRLAGAGAEARTEAEADDAWGGGAALARLVHQVAQDLRALPGDGSGYGLLRYLNPVTAPALTGLARPQILFNYLGRFAGAEAADGQDGGFVPAPEAPALSAAADPDMPVDHCLQIDALVRDRAGHPELTAEWSWPQALLSRDEAEELAEEWARALSCLAEHGASAAAAAGPAAGASAAAAARELPQGAPGAEPAAPSFPLAGLDQDGIDRLTTKYPDLEDVLPLSPLQEGMLFHAAYDQQGLDVYTGQLVLDLDGEPDTAALRAACHQMLRRHSALRAGFVTEGLPHPVQAVLRDVELPFTEIDLSALAKDERTVELERLLADDRARRFDLARPPLLRFTLIRLGSRAHRLVLANHHILWDGWSLAVLLKELFAAYRHLTRTGADAGVTGAADAAVPYRSYLSWLARQDREAAQDAWRQALDGLDEPTTLATADPHRTRSLPERIAVELSEDLTARLAARARGAGVTLNSVLQGAWAVLLTRLTGRGDVVFGSTVSGRNPEIAGVENMVGLLINTLPVRFAGRPEEPLIEAIARLQAEQAPLMDHQYLGIADIQRAAGLGTLFDTAVAFENYPMDTAELADLGGGLRLAEAQATDATHYTVNLIVVPGRRLSLNVDYRPDALSGEAATSIAGALERLLETVADAPDTPSGRLDLLSAADRERVLREWNATGHAVPEGTVPELFEAQVARTPEQQATVFEGESLTYAELNARADRLSRRLIGHGAGPERVVALALRRSIELVVAILATLKAGAAYMPLDPDLPAERLRYLLDDAAPQVLLTTSAIAAELPAEEGVLRLLVNGDEGEPAVDALSGVERIAPLLPHHPAYLIYTSGSTGRPKGAAITHHAVVNRLVWMQGAYGLDAGDRVLQKTPFGFDVSVWEFLWPLLTGATLVVARPDGHKDPVYLARTIRDEAITTVHFVPSMLRAFLDEPAAAQCSSLRRVVCSGEALPRDLHDAFHATLDAPLHNLYGPTEAAIDVTHWTCRPQPDATSVPIGHPVWNTQIYVLDSELRPVPPGLTGELFIAGRQLARGYHGRPGLTAERFLPNPYDEPGARMYRSGDLARHRPDGSLEYLGRADDQVKIRGFRIELGEIENQLAQCAGVAQAVVRTYPDAGGDTALAAYAVPAPGGTLDTADVLQQLRRTLPEYMIPASLTILDHLPTTPNGKANRAALPLPSEDAPVTEYVPPASETEELVAEVWAEVLGGEIDKIGRFDDFFALGGHSLKATRVISRLNTRLETQLPLHLVFDHRTVAGLAEAIETTLLDDLLAAAEDTLPLSSENHGDFA